MSAFYGLISVMQINNNKNTVVIDETESKLKESINKNYEPQECLSKQQIKHE